MKQALLALVQDTLRAMNSDMVTAVNDTEESRQVALIAKEIYEYLEVLREWPHKIQSFQLDVSSLGLIPVELNLPAGVSQLRELRYKQPVDQNDLSKGYCLKPVAYISPFEYVSLTKCTGTEDNIETINLYDRDLDVAFLNEEWPNDDIMLGIKDDKEPEYYTLLNGQRVLFDSYNSTRQSSGLVNSDAIGTGYVMYNFDNTDDTYVIQIPDRDWVLYKALIKARAWEDVKQAPNANASQIARRLMIRAQNEQNHIKSPSRQGTNYGR